MDPRRHPPGWRPDQPGRQALLSGRDHLAIGSVVQTTPRGLAAPTTADLERLARARPPEQRDRFELTVDRPYVEWPGGGGYQPATIRINGTDLVDLARAVGQDCLEWHR